MWGLFVTVASVAVSKTRGETCQRHCNYLVYATDREDIVFLSAQVEISNCGPLFCLELTSNSQPRFPELKSPKLACSDLCGMVMEYEYLLRILGGKHLALTFLSRLG